VNRSKTISLAILIILSTSACGNTVNGPRRLIQQGEIDHGDVADAACLASTDAGNPGADLNELFYRAGCAALSDPSNPTLARQMIDAGVTLNRVRCTDFFAERAGHQTRERILRGAVAPLSALITGILAVANFKTDGGRKEALQILSIGQSATVAGLELYESEFLFGAANVNSVRTLTMRALNEHATGILTQDVQFFGAARHLIDHQMICTPANILELSQNAIREGKVVPRTTASGNVKALTASADQNMLATITQSMRAPTLTDDQLGSLWWLSELVKAGRTTDQDRLAVIGDRLAKLPVSPIQGTAGALTVDTPLIVSFAPMLNAFSPPVLSGFEITKRLLDAKIAETVPASVLERTRIIRFAQPSLHNTVVAEAVEVGIAPASPDQ
jgi:hypothetical protein